MRGVGAGKPPFNRFGPSEASRGIPNRSDGILGSDGTQARVGTRLMFEVAPNRPALTRVPNAW